MALDNNQSETAETWTIEKYSERGGLIVMRYLNPRYQAPFRPICDGSRTPPSEVLAETLGRCPKCRRLLAIRKDGTLWDHRKWRF